MSVARARVEDAMALVDLLEKPVVVQKYGGSSVASSEHLRRVAKRIVETVESGKHVVVVVSAMAAATDDLLASAKEVSANPARRELDMLLSCGERASMALLAMAVSDLGHQAVSLTGSQSGIMTNDRHTGARIIEVRPIRVIDELERGNVVIVAGFQGVSYRREITTLGRGGSDTTAVALAAALQAEYCEICSDVDGIYSADPRVVSAAEALQAIRSDEMLELAAHGAKVLHKSCVEIAREFDVRLYARATAKQGGGTLIDLVGSPERQRPVGVTGMKDVVEVAAPTSSSLLEILGDAGVACTHMEARAGIVRAYFGLADVPDWSKVRDCLEKAGASVSEKFGIVSVVGAGIGESPSKILGVLALAGNVDAMNSSPLRVSLVCRAQEVDELVRRLHRHLVEGQED